MIVGKHEIDPGRGAADVVIAVPGVGLRWIWSRNAWMPSLSQLARLPIASSVWTASAMSIFR